MEFNSPTSGKLTLDEVYREIERYIFNKPGFQYRLIIGTDSQTWEQQVCFVTAVIIYRIGKGGRFFYHQEEEKTNRSLRQRIFYETSRSLEVAGELTMKLSEAPEEIVDKLDMEIHLDVGREGPTKELIKEVVGMVVGSGFNAKIKPDAYGASKVADKYTK
ncbi:MAG: ribonuclease H-like YkuK family protein [Halanaerobium sp.]|nr:ribonuclease H-like YkuK family protein [Halanaerobium sp.]